MIIVGVSGGIDSMVLLDKLYKDGYDIVVAHVNYQKRSDSFNDEIVIKEYIKDKNIVFEKKVVEDYTNENFQAQARKIRYDFFEEIAQKYNASDLYIAHHKDDFLETYLFKIERKGLYEYYGIKERTKYKKLNVIRPLLQYTKEDIIEYAINNNIKYYEDSSNMSEDYTRNKIRVRLNKMSKVEKDKLYQDALILNNKVQKEIAFVSSKLNNKISVEEFKNWDIVIKRRWLFMQIKKYDISIKHLDEIIKKIESVPSFKDTILDTTVAVSYGIIYILDLDYYKYYYIINNSNDLENVKNTFFNMFNYQIGPIIYDYPFVIRAYKLDDFTELKLDYRKFRRHIKKSKVPFFIREHLPVLEKSGKVAQFL